MASQGGWASSQHGGFQQLDFLRGDDDDDEGSTSERSSKHTESCVVRKTKLSCRTGHVELKRLPLNSTYVQLHGGDLGQRRLAPRTPGWPTGLWEVIHGCH